MPTFTIIYDTYCGWCYGAAPVLDALADTGRATLFHRYLFQDQNACRMGNGFGTQAAVINMRIHQLTGQPFGAHYKRNILQSADEVLGSGLAAQAACLMQNFGAKAEMAFAATLQRSYFVEGRSTQDFNFIADCLVKFGLNSLGLGSEDLRKAAVKRGQKAEAICDEAGAIGVPTVLRHTDTTEIINLSEFYRTPADITHLAH